MPNTCLLNSPFSSPSSPFPLFSPLSPLLPTETSTNARKLASAAYLKIFKFRNKTVYDWVPDYKHEGPPPIRSSSFSNSDFPSSPLPPSASFHSTFWTNSVLPSSPLPPSSPSSFPPLLPSFTASQAKLLENQVGHAADADADDADDAGDADDDVLIGEIYVTGYRARGGVPCPGDVSCVSQGKRFTSTS